MTSSITAMAASQHQADIRAAARQARRTRRTRRYTRRPAADGARRTP